VWKWPVVKYKRIKKSQEFVYIHFVFDLDGECKFIKTKQNKNITQCLFSCAIITHASLFVIYNVLLTKQKTFGPIILGNGAGKLE